MKYIFAILILLTFSSTCYAKFEGKLSFSPSGCEKLGKCSLDNALKFTDPNNLVWLADAGLITDGASIPKWAQLIIGKPFDESFIKAAVIHDHYCDRHVRSWRKTHKAFYYALIDLGVSKVKANTMYGAVYSRGPKWVTLIKGVVCGDNCTNSTKIVKIIKKRSAQYEKPGFIEELEELENVLKKNSDMSLKDIEAYIENKEKDDYYFNNGDVVDESKDILINTIVQ